MCSDRGQSHKSHIFLYLTDIYRVFDLSMMYLASLDQIITIILLGSNLLQFVGWPYVQSNFLILLLTTLWLAPCMCVSPNYMYSSCCSEIRTQSHKKHGHTIICFYTQKVASRPVKSNSDLWKSTHLKRDLWNFYGSLPVLKASQSKAASHQEGIVGGFPSSEFTVFEGPNSKFKAWQRFAYIQN